MRLAQDRERSARRAGANLAVRLAAVPICAVALLGASLASALLMVPSPVLAASASSPAAEVDRYLAGLSSWSADFKQTIDDAQGKVLRSATGHLDLQRPGKFRWDYTAPSEQLMLADGSKLWFYDKDLAQANVRDLDATLASTPAMLLSSSGSVSSQFDIAALPAAEGLQWFALKPKHAGTDFQIIKIGFDKGELAEMRLVDKLNEVTQLRFSAQQRNRSFAADLFTFTPPPGVDVIGRDPRSAP